MKLTMRNVFHALVKELGYEKGKGMFEWYCKTYNVSIEDNIPPAILREVFGL